MKRILADILVIGMGIALLWHFSNIWRLGQFYIQEPSIIKLALETILLSAIIGFGIYMFLEDLKEGE